MTAQPKAPLRILRRQQVQDRTGLSRSTMYLHIQNGTFPAPLALGARTVGWAEHDIDAWIVERLEKGGAEREARKAQTTPKQRKAAN